jgi:hypothetical protein
MPKRTRWARAVIAAGSLAGLIVIIVAGYVFLPTGTARLLSLIACLCWAVALIVAWVTWGTYPDGSRKMRLPLAATVVGLLAAVTVSGEAPGAILARIGRPEKATVVAENVEPLGGSGAYRYTLQDGSGRPIPGEIKDSFDTYDVGDSVWVLTDPRGIVTTDDVRVVASERWRPVIEIFTGIAISFGLVAMLLCFLAGYLASGPYNLRTVRRLRLSK